MRSLVFLASLLLASLVLTQASPLPEEEVEDIAVPEQDDDGSGEESSEDSNEDDSEESDEDDDSDEDDESGEDEDDESDEDEDDEDEDDESYEDESDEEWKLIEHLLQNKKHFIGIQNHKSLITMHIQIIHWTIKFDFIYFMQV